MGRYVNPNVRKFQMSLNSEIYVDKTGLIEKTNELFDTEKRYICLSRPRRFGKTMAANMLAAYYGRKNDAKALFEDLKISEQNSFIEHLNQYDVIMLNIQEFLSSTQSVDEMLDKIQKKITKEFKKEHPEISYDDENDFIQVMYDTYEATERPFVILIDEWDCLFREYKDDVDAQKKYLDFLRLWLKDQSYVGLAYMTGILPIKKYGSHSALNMFEEYSMTEPSQFLEYFGFKTSEVEELALTYGADIDEIKKWYNGYFVDLGNPIYNPKSVTSCLMRKNFSSYWNKTETYEALKDYIKLDYDGLKNKITIMISGQDIIINPNKFTNDMTTFNSADDVLTLLVHLGYLTYNFKRNTVRIPNEEVKGEFINSIEDIAGWETVISAIENSEQLLQAIWDRNTNVITEFIQKAHEQNTSILEYNDENSLSCILALALYSAKNYYTIIRELPTGKGYADLVFIPQRNHQDKPAMIIELKWDESAKGAIAQIQEKNYPSALESYRDNLLLIGINYDKKTKTYDCIANSIIESKSTLPR